MKIPSILTEKKIDHNETKGWSAKLIFLQRFDDRQFVVMANRNWTTSELSSSR
jgi:hypothetical protein